MAVCPNCGASVPEGSRFCIECGAKLEAAPAIITADTPVPEPELTLPEVPEMDVPVPEVPAVEPEFSPAPVTEAVPAPAEEPAPAPVFDPAPQSAPVFTPPAAEAPKPAPVPPVYQQPAPVPPVYQQPAPAAPVYQQPAPDADKPGKKSKYAPMTSWGMAIQLILMAIPFVGFVLMVVWACGGCRKIARRNLARANLILLIIAIVLTIVAALLARFLFAEDITRVFEEILPGYTLQWG